MKNVKLPKTFVVRVETPTRDWGYFRFKSYVRSDGVIRYSHSLTKKITEASYLVNIDNAKERAKEYLLKYPYPKYELIDTVSKKHYVIH